MSTAGAAIPTDPIEAFAHAIADTGITPPEVIRADGAVPVGKQKVSS